MFDMLSREELISGLQTEQTFIRTEAERRLAILDDAINALRCGDDTVTPMERAKPVSVADMALLAAETFGDVVWDREKLQAKMNELFPNEVEKIKRGIYTVISQLKTRKAIVMWPGGFILAKYYQAREAATTQPSK